VISPDVTEALLFEIFNAIGPVSSVRVCRDSQTRRSLGYAYVNFHRGEDAERALDTMNFKNIRNRPCRIMWSHRDPSLRKSGLGNIFVKNLAKSIDNKQLYDTFSIFGNILSCKVAMNAKRESLGYGFVHYESEEAAANAIQKVDGKVIAEQKVSVAAFKSKKDRGAAKTKFTNLYVKNLPSDFTKDKLDALFGKYGKVTSSVLAFDKDQKSRGFGFVNFQAPEEASAALGGLNNQDIDGKQLYVSRAQKKEERERELHDRFEAIKAERQRKYQGVNLYVKNLADDCDDKHLREEFAKFGSITSAKVMLDTQTKKSRGFGFVCFSTPEEATKAVSEMNNKLVDGKPLYVGLAQRREVRRAQLEARSVQRAKIQQGGQYQPYQQQMFPGQMQFPFQQMPQQQRMFYGQQGMGQMGVGQMNMGRWPPQMQQQAGMGFQLMQMNGGGRGQQGGFQQGRRGGRGRGGMLNQGQMRQPQQQQQQQQMGRGMVMQQQQQPQTETKQQGFEYGQNVRNQNRQQPQQNSVEAQLSPQEAVISTPQGGSEPLTIKALAAAPEKQKKQMIGEQLFPRIKSAEPQLAGKITGMLLEMDNGELIHLLESQEALAEKISEAKQVLLEHDQDDGEEGDGN